MVFHDDLKRAVTSEGENPDAGGKSGDCPRSSETGVR